MQKFSKMDFFKKSSKFFEKCSESSDSSRKLKISKSIFSHIKWVKTLEKIFKNGIFQKSLRIFWFIQKIENLKINFFPYKMGQNTCKNFQKWIFSKKLKIFWKMLRIFWFIQKIESLKIYFFQYKMGQNTKKFSKMDFFKNAQNCLIRPDN